MNICGGIQSINTFVCKQPLSSGFKLGVIEFQLFFDGKFSCFYQLETSHSYICMVDDADK